MSLLLLFQSAAVAADPAIVLTVVRSLTLTVRTRSAGMVRSVVESPLAQGEDERIAYGFDWAEVGTPGGPAVVLKDMTAGGVDVSATKLSGAASVDGDVVVTPKVIELEPGTKYRLECKVTIGGNVLEAYVEIFGEE